jgi:solute carrier family 25 protein 39/40
VRYSDENSLELKPYAPLLAGSIARSVAVVVCAPLELAKTRMQVRILNKIHVFLCFSLP